MLIIIVDVGAALPWRFGRLFSMMYGREFGFCRLACMAGVWEASSFNSYCSFLELRL